MNLRLFSIIFLVSILFVVKKSFAANGESIFKTDTIHEIRLYFDQPHYWDTLRYRYDDAHQMDADDIGEVKPIMAKFTIDKKVVDSIGVKLKSNFSYSIETNKKPMKLDFNAFVKSKNVDGLRSLNLSNEFPDPSLLRNTVAYKILRDAGVRSPRTSFARVFINDKYYGLYVVIEQVDKIFISHNFNNTSGELIKVIASSLFYEELDTASFRRGYEIKMHNNSQSWEHLMSLAKRIKITPANIFYDSLKNVFDFESYLRVFAADIIFNNWDSYFFGQNYYLYRDSAMAKYFFIPWDYNLSLNYYEESGGNYPILPGAMDNHLFKLPLPSKVVDNAFLRKEYLNSICEVNKIMSSKSTEDFIMKTHAMLTEALKSDSGKVFTSKQYDQSLTAEIAISEFKFTGLIAFIKYRSKQISDALKAEGVDCKN